MPAEVERLRAPGALALSPPNALDKRGDRVSAPLLLKAPDFREDGVNLMPVRLKTPDFCNDSVNRFTHLR